jgi:endonuclease/exonuclease/phosphatase (EEP) superfamily protein YafD
MSKRLVNNLLFLAIPLVFCTILVLTSWLLVRSWWVELLSFFVPVILVLTVLLLIVGIRVRPGRWHMAAVLLAVLATVKPGRATLVFNRTAPDAPHDLSVMSFNAALFNPYRSYTLESDPHLLDEFYQYLRTTPSPDVLCIQEFYHSGLEENTMTADSIVKLGGYTSFYTNPRYDEDFQGVVGVMTFSTLPMVGRGRLVFGQDDVYNGHWVDIASGADTVRVFNLQLRSMSIRWHRDRGLWDNLTDIYQRLLRGYEAREVELAAIERYLRASPYPVIVCADINALPYSITYRRLRMLFENAFEQKGRGLGFTYRDFPWFVRIDNQFFSPSLEATHFEVLPDIAISDHYPILAHYRLRNGSVQPK